MNASSSSSSSSSSKLIILLFFSLFTTTILQVAHSTTLVVDGWDADWRNSTVHIGDSIIFKDKYQYNNLYIFQNERAFNLCNFTQATLLTKPNSTPFKWNPSRPGFFYFSFDNGSHIACQEGQKLAIQVSLSQTPASTPTSSAVSPISATPAPTTGGTIPSNPAYKWPFGSQYPPASSPTPALTANSPVAPLLPDKGDNGMPFINSNPAVPLPTGEVDSTTIRPLPTSGHEKQVVGLLTAQMPLLFMVFLIL